MMEQISLTLPEWAFLDTQYEGNPLGTRTVILHVRSATVIEIFDRDVERLKLNPEVVTYKFGNKRTGESMIAALHYSTTIDDYEQLKALLKKCAIWYVNYTDWEDAQTALMN